MYDEICIVWGLRWGEIKGTNVTIIFCQDRGVKEWLIYKFDQGGSPKTCTVGDETIVESPILLLSPS